MKPGQGVSKSNLRQTSKKAEVQSPDTFDPAEIYHFYTKKYKPSALIAALFVPMKIKSVINQSLIAMLAFGLTAVAFASEDEKESEKEIQAAKDAEYAAKLQASESDSKEADSKSDSEKDNAKNSVSEVYDLDVSKAIKVGGTDEASKIFMEKVLPQFYKISTIGAEYKGGADDFSAAYLDGKGLTLKEDTQLRAYFVGESSKYVNTLGFSIDNTEKFFTIFDDASTLASFDGKSSEKRTENAPLQPGDFVDLGDFKAGTNLDFGLFSYSGEKLRSFLSTEMGLNPDGLIHALALASEGSTYLLIGFENSIKGGDKDFNDVVFALEFSHSSHGSGPDSSISAPEPSLAIGSLFSAGVLLFQRRRRQA